ncbi:MAG: fibronectin type III domain-containing protein [Eubacterium sp.]
MKKLISIILSVSMLVSVFGSLGITAGASTYADQLKAKGFTGSYIPALEELHKKYPNWKFEPLVTGLKWSDVISGERTPHSQQVIEKSSDISSAFYCKCADCYKNGSYVIREGSNWVSASESAVKYYMDPRNWLSEKYIFQFESTKYSDTQTKAGVEAILDGTWMHNSLITYKNTAGVTKQYSSTVKYSDAIMTAAKNSGMSAYYLASKIRQENGGSSPTATAVCGTKAPFQGIYNYYNIGANAGASDGLAWAAGYLKVEKDAKLYPGYNTTTKKVTGTPTTIKAGQYMTYRDDCGDYYYVRLYVQRAPNSYIEGDSGYVLKSACRTTYFNYNRPWTNPYKAIIGGANRIADMFGQQYTGYLQKFNVNPKSDELYNHEYMTNVQGAAQESATTYNAYKNSGIISGSRTFYIPVFTGMPSTKCPKPTNPIVTPAKVTGLKLSSRTTTSLTLKWDKVTGAKGYYLYRYYSDTKTYKKVRTVSGGSNTSITVSGLTPGSNRRYAVAAYATKVGTRSARLSVATSPSKVTFTSLTALSSGRLKSNWKKVSGYATGYQIYWSRNKSFTNVVAKTKITGKSTVSYTGKGFNKGVRYYVKVRAYKVIDGKTFYGAWSGYRSVVAK